MLVVSHDRTFLSEVCTDIVHMRSQQLDCYRGNYEVGGGGEGGCVGLGCNAVYD